jgi:uncharacterized membrane protein YoaK (UPF0700 family)
MGALAAASGAIDITAFIRLGGVFASVMTGNLVLLGLAVERASGVLLAHTAVAFGGYITGVAVGAAVVGKRAEKTLWPHRVTATFVVEVIALVAFTVGWELTKGRPTSAVQLGLLAVAAIAMGIQSEAVRNVSAKVSTTYLTGTLTAAVASIVHRRDTEGSLLY